MELVYLWIKHYKNLDNFEVNLNPKYNVEFNKETYSVKISQKEYFNIFGDNINIIAFAGMNGCGKSNLIDVLKKILDTSTQNEPTGIDIEYILILKSKKVKKFYYYLTNHSNIEKLSNNEQLKHYTKSVKSILLRQFSPVNESEKITHKNTDVIISNYKKSYQNGYFYYDKFNKIENFYPISNLYNYDYKKNQLLLFRDNAYLKFNAFQFTKFSKDELNISQRLRILNNSRMAIVKSLVNKALEQNEKCNIIENALSVRLIELTQKALSQYRRFNKQNYSKTMYGVSKQINNDCLSEQIKFLHSMITKWSKDTRLTDEFQEFLSLANFYMENCSNNFQDIIDNINYVMYNSHPINEYKGSSIIDYIQIDVQDVYVTKFLNSIIRFDFINKEQNYMDIPYSFNQLSSGEQRILRFLSDIITIFSAREINNGKKPTVVFLDEIDLSWHPDWQRNLILYLVDILKNILLANETVTFIISTHSPFILSDIPDKNIILMKRKDNEDNDEDEDEDFKTFGTNIHTLLAKNFFMKSTIGAFAEKKIKEVINKIRNNEDTKFCNNVIELMDDSIYKTLIKNMQLYQFDNTKDSCNEKNK